PIFLLAGGPGQAAIEIFPFVLSQLNNLNNARDIVLVDQRGTGESNPLDCVPFVEDLELDTDDEQVFGALAECRESLAAENDLTQYITDIAMRDLDAVRQQLGYGQINLIGTSYGSRAAQRYMTLYPDQVRSAVLNGVTGSELVLMLQAPQDGQRALELLLARCEADSGCAEAFPDLDETIADLIGQVAGGIETEIVHPSTSEKVTVEVNEELLMQLVFNIMYSADLVSILPLILTEAAESGDYSPIVGQGLLVSESAGLYQGLFYSVACTEDATLIDETAAEASNDGTFFPEMSVNLLQACEGWPTAALDPAFRDPFQSDIPTLLLSGDADPITPPTYAEELLTGLSNGRHIVIPQYGHDVLTVGCVPNLVGEFISEATAADLEDDCLAEIVPPPFFVSLTGPTP
ncbi:MAG: alpha/beta hydrolase, partial [Chloroflexota bacterium]